MLSPNVNAVGFCPAAIGCVGEHDTSNSLVGNDADDGVGADFPFVQPDGSYIVLSPSWDDPQGAANVGAATLGNGIRGAVGVISAENSVVGSVANDVESVAYDRVRRRLVVGRSGSNVVTVPESGGALLGMATLAALARRRGVLG